MLRAMTLQFAGDHDEDSQHRIAEFLVMALENGWWMQYRSFEQLAGDPLFVMDAGGNDDVAFAISIAVSDENELQLRMFMTKWKMRPSDFEGRLKVVRIVDVNEEDKVWLKYEHNLRDFMHRLGEICEQNGFPVERTSGQIVIGLSLFGEGEDVNEPAKYAELQRFVQKWIDRMNLTPTRGS